MHKFALSQTKRQKTEKFAFNIAIIAETKVMKSFKLCALETALNVNMSSSKLGDVIMNMGKTK